LEVNTADHKLRERFRTTFAEHRAEGRKFLLQRETPILPLSTSTSVIDQLRQRLGNPQSSPSA
jgi:hypothetical protein